MNNAAAMQVNFVKKFESYFSTYQKYDIKMLEDIQISNQLNPNPQQNLIESADGANVLIYYLTVFFQIHMDRLSEAESENS